MHNIKEFFYLDEIVSENAKGCYALPSRRNEPKYNIRGLIKYAYEKGVDTSELTKEELEKFKLRPLARI